MDIVDNAINEYAEKHSSPESSALRELNRETHAKVLMPRMLSGQLQGRFLSMISHMIKPKMVLEIGTYTGYSAICFAEGLAEGGKVHTIDINDELGPLIKSYVSKAGMAEKIVTHFGDAVKIIPQIPGPYDLVFIDADKINYPKYYDLVFDKVRSGGFIVADNVLWSGKILDDIKLTDKDTKALIAFNDMISNDTRVENVMLTIRDGLMIVRKK